MPHNLISMSWSIVKWSKISLINLFIVASIGVVLRYKIAFYLPFINQKHLLHGHSHFAFSGWISLAIMTMLVEYLKSEDLSNAFKRYQWILFAHLMTSYGMLIAFPIEGYGLWSIIFSTLSIFTSYVFAVYYIKDLNRLHKKNSCHLWFKAAVIFNAVSSIGAFALAIMMITKFLNQSFYLAAEYFYLHFQYNGWFFFGCMGLISYKLLHFIADHKLRKVFYLFFAAMLPTYFLSALWMDIPYWVYAIVVVASILQVIACVYLFKLIKKNNTNFKAAFPFISRWLIICAGIALSIKVSLQLVSTIPSLSNLAYGFRPIVIGYLHLVFLCVITLFLLGFMFANNAFEINKYAIRGAVIFTIGIIINEIFLMIQGVASLYYITIPLINQSLFFAALIMFFGLYIFVSSQKIQSEFSHNLYPQTN